MSNTERRIHPNPYVETLVGDLRESIDQERGVLQDPEQAHFHGVANRLMELDQRRLDRVMGLPPTITPQVAWCVANGRVADRIELVHFKRRSGQRIQGGNI